MGAVVESLSAAAELVRGGAVVTIRPQGRSMRPLVRAGQVVKIAPVRPEAIEPNDIVLVRIADRTYLHKVLAVEPIRRRARIGDNRGLVNGWIDFEHVYGICIEIDGIQRPRVEGKETNPERPAPPPAPTPSVPPRPLAFGATAHNLHYAR